MPRGVPFLAEHAADELPVRLHEVPVHDGVDDGVEAVEEPGGAGHPDVGHGLGLSGVDQVGDEVGGGAHEEADENEQHHSRQPLRPALAVLPPVHTPAERPLP